MKPNDLINSVTQSVIKCLESSKLSGEVLSWRKTLKGGLMPINYLTKQRYSGLNVFLLWKSLSDAGYSCNKWVTFKQAQQLGLKLRPKSKGAPIIRYGTYLKEITDREGNPIINPETGKPEETDRGFLKTYYVFNLAQMENCPEEELQEQSPPESGYFEEAKRVFDYSGAKVFLGNNQSFYSPMHDTIFMPNAKQFNRIEEFYTLYNHELIHWSGASHRLDRLTDYHLKKGRGFEELVAELGATFLGAQTGIMDLTLRESHTNYLDYWLKDLKENPKYLYSAASLASKAFEYILAEVATNEANTLNKQNEQLKIA